MYHIIHVIGIFRPNIKNNSLETLVLFQIKHASLKIKILFKGTFFSHCGLYLIFEKNKKQQHRNNSPDPHKFRFFIVIDGS